MATHPDHRRRGLAELLVRVVAAGANVLVAGSAVFGQDRPWEAAETIRRSALATAN